MTEVRQPTERDKLIGQRLKDLRGDRTYKAFAIRACVNEELLPQWEAGTLQPGKYVLCLILRKLGEGQTIHYFFDGEMPPKDYPN